LNKLLSFIRNHEHDTNLALFLLSILAGIFYLRLSSVDPGAEMMQLARNLAASGTFGNPFQSIPTGVSANNPPLYPLFVATLIKVFGSPMQAMIVALLVAILANASVSVMLPRISDLIWGNTIPGVLAAGLWMVTMQPIPAWDTNITVAGLIGFCLFTSPIMRKAENPTRRAVLAGIFAGLLYLLNPSSILILLPWIAFLFWHARASWRRAAVHCVVLVAVMSLFAVGWGLRNYRELGAFVTRTNLGIALYASNNDCAQSTLLRNVLSGCFKAHHPDANVDEAELLRQMGEVPYDRMRVADAKRWMQAHPQKFMTLTGQRFIEFWFPATEMIPAVTPSTPVSAITAMARRWARAQNFFARAIWIVTALSLPGLILMLVRREPMTVFIVATLAIYPLMYYMVNADMRYRYPVLWLSLLPAGYCLREVFDGGLFRSCLPSRLPH
jgi:hypothetical protein